MADKETIMTWLKKCGNGGCSSRCPYDDLGPDKCYETLMTDALKLLKSQPEIVRCKNCKHGKPVEAVFDDRYECHLLGSYISSDFALPPDWFCGDGEARQDE